MRNRTLTFYLALLFGLGASMLANNMAIAAPENLMAGKEVNAMVSKALPTWDASILEAKQGKDWTTRISFERIAKAMGDKPIRAQKLPDIAQKVSDESRTIRFKPGMGTLRYINRARAWDYKKHAQTKAIDAREASSIVQKAIDNLGIPQEERGKIRVDTQIAAGGVAGKEEITDQFEMYRIVSIPRMINKLPVYSSGARAAISNDAQIQRLQLAWPAFRMDSQLTLRSRRDVIKQVAREMMAQDLEKGARVHATLVYTPRTHDDEEIVYVPAVVVSVYSKPTPYQVVVPVAEAASRK